MTNRRADGGQSESSDFKNHLLSTTASGRWPTSARHLCVLCVLWLKNRVYSCPFVVAEKESRVCFIVFAGGLSIMLFEKEPDVLCGCDAAEQG